MVDFRALSDRMDREIFNRLGDAVRIDGRPVRGMFAAPWLQPQLGRLNTSLREPMLTVRDADAVSVAKDMLVEVPGEGEFVVVNIEPDGTGDTVLVLRRPKRETR